MAASRRKYRSRVRRSGPSLVKLTVIGFLVVCGIGVFVLNEYYQLHERTVTVCEKERTDTKDGGEYRIYSDSGTFALKDAHNFFIGRWRTDTADVYGQLREGTTYDISFYGPRVGLFSMMPNIWVANPAPEGRQNPEACRT